MSRKNKKNKSELSSQLVPRVSFVLDAAQNLKEASESLAVALIQQEARSSVVGEEEEDIDELCFSLRVVLDMMRTLKEHACAAIPVIEDDLQDCLESQEDPTGEL